MNDIATIENIEKKVFVPRTKINNHNNDTIIKIQNLNVFAGEQHILKDVNLDIPKGQITVLLGSSGCGKTTLLKSMNRLTELYKELKVNGNIFIENEDILSTNRNLPLFRQKMGLLSQRPFPLPVSIYKNIAYGIKLKGIKDKKTINSLVEQKLMEVGLWNEVKDRLNNSPDFLSVGQQQRLCLARGLAVEPSIILADEPTSALDPVSSKLIENLFRTLKNKYTIVIVTHILRQAQRLADNVIFMHAGRIIEQGKPEELFKNPRSSLLKEYLVEGN